MKTGRPPGKAHPMPMFEFWILFLEQLPVCDTVQAAYFEAEKIVIELHGRRRFGTYQSFKKAKCVWYKSKIRKK